MKIYTNMYTVQDSQAGPNYNKRKICSCFRLVKGQVMFKRNVYVRK